MIVTVGAIAQSRPDLCLQALKAAAYNEYKVTEKSSWEQHFHHAFCDAVHKKEQNQSSTSGDFLTDALFLHLQDDRSSLQEYDHTYCESTSLDTRYDLEYSFWSKVVAGDALGKFNECMKIVTPTNGLITDVQTLDQCHFNASVKFTPTSPKNQQFARMNHDATLLNASCGKIPYKSQKIDEAGIPVTCARFGRQGSFIVLDTDQGPAVISVPDLPLPQKPPAIAAPPEWDDVDPATNRPYAQDFNVNWPGVPAGTTCNPLGSGWTQCSGKFSLPAGAVVSAVSYACSSGYTDKGDQYCHWSYHRDNAQGRAGDVALDSNSFTWYRRYNTGSGMSETYHATYKVPHKKTAAENQYDKDLAEYDQKVKENVCPWNPTAPPTSWLSHIFGKN